MYGFSYNLGSVKSWRLGLVLYDATQCILGGLLWGWGVWFLLGGHCLPNSSIVTKMEWQNIQKNPSKKNASELKNRIIAYHKPFWIVGVGWPWNVLACMASHHFCSGTRAVQVALGSGIRRRCSESIWLALKQLLGQRCPEDWSGAWIYQVQGMCLVGNWIF